MAQVSGVTSKAQGYTAYPNDVPRFNPAQLPFNESLSGSSVYYQRRLEELTISLYQTEGMLAMVQTMNGSLQTTAIPRILAKVLCSEHFDNEMLKVQKVLIDHGHDLGRQEARDLLMSNQ
ncbi:hypothetical protein Tco_0782944 [Tanacetum coccineum]